MSIDPVEFRGLNFFKKRGVCGPQQFFLIILMLIGRLRLIFFNVIFYVSITIFETLATFSARSDLDRR